MAEGKLIVEVYEYQEDVEALPKYEYIPCELDKCFKRDKATLKEIIQQGLASRPDKLKETLRKIEEAGIDKIDVLYNKPTRNAEASIELTNVVQVSMADADASRKKNKRKNDIILYGKYRLSEGIRTTKLKDAQRLSLIYSNWEDKGDDAEDQAEEHVDGQKEICLNITFLQE